MHATKIVERMLGGCLTSLHATLAQAVIAAVNSAALGSRLSLSRLAAGMTPSRSMRQRIKRMDRLLGNTSLHQKRITIYHSLASQWLTGITPLLVVVDWSDATVDQRWHLLRASVAVEGRSVTLFEEIHPQQKYGDRNVHRRFLSRLAQLLPAGSTPIIMTDAGFRSTWFDLVNQRHWQWIGRIRGKDMICVAEGPWRRCTDFYREATQVPRAYPDVRYVRANPTPCRLVLTQRAPKGRTRRTRLGQRARSRTSLKASRNAREPWLLATSHGLDHLSADAIIALYWHRMRIEQSFRDLKNERTGLGLSASRSRSGQRLEILLLIGHLATWVMRLIGECAQQCQMHLHFQSTCRLNRKEISVLTLARRVIDAGSTWIGRLHPKEALTLLRDQAWQACHGF